MQKIVINGLLAALVLVFGASCNKQETSKPTGMQSVDVSSIVPEVETSVIRESVFHREILTNGTVVCSNYVDAFFNSNEVITEIRVQNGDHVSQGEIIAVLDDFQNETAVAQARIALEQAELELKDALIGQGYDPEHMEHVPTEVMSLLELRSGVKMAKITLAKAERGSLDRYVRAPFNGIVANLSQIKGNKADTHTPLCRILSAEDMDVEFKVIEPELGLISKGDFVEVIPGNGNSLKAKVSEINPIIGDDGQITLKAKITDPTGLITGQHVKITVKRDLERSIVVPKTSVVMRDHRPVVFTLSGDSTAQWNYVDVLHENLTEYSVDGLKDGMEVIVTGNKNLSQGNRVRKINQ